jgi:hypothetical protein
MSLPSRLLGANPSIQVSTLLSGSLSTPSAKQAFVEPGNFVSIASETLTGNQAYIEFSSIPSTYKHLVLRMNVRNTVSNEVMQYSFNGDTTNSNYRSSGTFRGGGNATAYWAPDTRYIQRSTGPSEPAGFFGANVSTIIDYARTTKTKIMLAETAGALDGAGNYAMFATSSEWKNTAAIHTIRIQPISGSFVANTVISLYGIL